MSRYKLCIVRDRFYIDRGTPDDLINNLLKNALNYPFNFVSLFSPKNLLKKVKVLYTFMLIPFVSVFYM